MLYNKTTVPFCIKEKKNQQTNNHLKNAFITKMTEESLCLMFL